MKGCPACGPWWLPGSEICSRHNVANGSYASEDGGYTPCHDAPRVYAEPDPFKLPVDKVLARLFGQGGKR